LNEYARAIANNDFFAKAEIEISLPEHKPKVHNSKNPIFLQSGASRFIIMYKPHQLIDA